MPDTIQPKEIVNKEPSHTNPPSSDMARDMNFISLKGFFNIENPLPEEEDAMNYIYDRFNKLGVENMSDILWALKDIQQTIGITPIGESRLVQVKNYMRVLDQIGELEKVKQSMQR